MSQVGEPKVQSRRVGRPPKAVPAPPAQAAEDAALLAQVDEIAEARAQERAAAPAQPGRGIERQSRAAPRRDSAEFQDEEGSPLRRRVNRNANPYDIPQRLKKPGWDYQWWAIRVMGEPVDASELVEAREGGWRPVPAESMKELVPPDWNKPHIERGGQVLYMRPMYLTEEARAEDLKLAEDQRYDKLKGALAGPAELAKIAPRIVDKMEIYGSVGNVAPKDGE